MRVEQGREGLAHHTEGHPAGTAKEISTAQSSNLGPEPAQV
jgi:hypothetical protein